MQITDILGSSGGLQNMARELGVSESDMDGNGNPLDDIMRMMGRR